MNVCTPCRPAMDAVLPETNYLEEYNKVVHQATIQDELRNRTILYATCGDSQGGPILFFPPLGASRRMILILNEVLQKHSLWAICVSRPGAEGTAAAEDAPSQVDTFSNDTLAVMDELKIAKAGIFCMCAGTPFALAFCAKHADRTTGKFLALGPWTLPADCPNSKRLERFAAHYLHTLFVSSLVGSIQSTAMHYFGPDLISNKLRDASSDVEKKCLEERHKDQPEGAFGRELDWVIGKVHNEKLDIAVCLSRSADLGFNYKDIEGQDVVIWQGSDDKLALLPATKWLAEQLPNASLHLIPGSTHQGALFMLGTEYMDSVAHLKVV
jgi:pimeloyl-ACP methyl ester carboxylesterase